MTNKAIELAQILALICEGEYLSIYKLIVEEVYNTLKNGNTIFICGNGGSYSIAEHFSSEFTGKFNEEKRPHPVMALGGGSHLTCVSNDYEFKDVFSRQIEAFSRSGDLLIAMSTSGNSDNILEAIKSAKSMNIISLLGKDGGKMKDLTQLEYIVPSHNVARIQEIHQFLLHCIAEDVLKQLK